MVKSIYGLAAMLLVVSLVGCSQDTSPEPAATASAAPNIDVAHFLLDEEPAGAQEVIAVREEAKNDDPVVIVGRIGGSKDPWSEGRAAFSIVDNSLLACSDREGDDCPVPWDYCCETDKLPGATALVKIVDPSGQLIKVDARELLKLEELATVVVQGEAKRDEAGNLTILATGVYVQK
jgi:hypothetical protein